MKLRTYRPWWHPWWFNKYTAWYLAGTAGLVAGVAVMLFAPEWADILKEWML